MKIPERAITYVSLLIGLVGIAISVYACSYQRRSSVTYKIHGFSDVIGVTSPVKHLSILFQDQDITATKQNLKLLALEVTNTGEIDIALGSYDEKTIWGFQTTRGKIIDIRMVDASSDYLKGAVKPTTISDTDAAFEKVIFDRGQSFKVEALILHPLNTQPQIKQLGKIAGVDTISLVSAPADDPFLSGVKYVTRLLWSFLIGMIVGTMFSFVVALRDIPEFRSRILANLPRMPAYISPGQASSGSHGGAAAVSSGANGAEQMSSQSAPTPASGAPSAPERME